MFFTKYFKQDAQHFFVVNNFDDIVTCETDLSDLKNYILGVAYSMMPQGFEIHGMKNCFYKLKIII